jgi:hypothetical protein
MSEPTAEGARIRFSLSVAEVEALLKLDLTSLGRFRDEATAALVIVKEKTS